VVIGQLDPTVSIATPVATATSEAAILTITGDYFIPDDMGYIGNSVRVVLSPGGGCVVSDAVFEKFNSVAYVFYDFSMIKWGCFDEWRWKNGRKRTGIG
jgi:hypothetical protein